MNSSRDKSRLLVELSKRLLVKCDDKFWNIDLYVKYVGEEISKIHIGSVLLTVRCLRFGNNVIMREGRFIISRLKCQRIFALLCQKGQYAGNTHCTMLLLAKLNPPLFFLGHSLFNTNNCIVRILYFSYVDDQFCLPCHSDFDTLEISR